jgi:hypothetical protein
VEAVAVELNTFSKKPDQLCPRLRQLADRLSFKDELTKSDSKGKSEKNYSVQSTKSAPSKFSQKEDCKDVSPFSFTGCMLLN